MVGIYLQAYSTTLTTFKHIANLVHILPDFEEHVELLLKLAQLEVERIGAAHLWHDVEDVFNFLDLKFEWTESF